MTQEMKGSRVTIESENRKWSFDIHTTNEGKPFLTINEVLDLGEVGGELNTITLFPEQIEEFIEALSTVKQNLQSLV